MIIKEFSIPLDKDELTRTYFGQYGHRDPVPLQMLNREINAMNMQQMSETEPSELVHEKLDLFLSVIVHGKKVELVLLLRFFGKILKILQNLIGYLEKRDEQTQELEVEQNEKMKLLFANKALAYVVSTTLCLIEDLVAENNSSNGMVNAGRRKKPAQKSDTEEEWETQREKVMETVQRWLQLPLKNVWSPPIVEDSFVGTVSQICYKILEKTKDIKSKTTQTLIFQHTSFHPQILGTLVKRYNHGIACVVRIIQLAKFHEALAVPIGTGVVLMATECGCTGLIKEIAREIAQNDIGEADARNFGSFLEAVATAQPDIVLPIIDNIMDYLSSESYVMRNCAISILGIVVPSALTGDDLSAEKRAVRDDCLDYLEEHILDTSSYVRSKVLQTWQKLCCERALPVSRQNQLLQACILRLEDKVASVRKQALQLLRAILQNNPFASKMNQEKFSQNLEQAKADLKQLQTDVYHTIGVEEEKEELWKTQLPMIEEAIDKFTEDNTMNNNDEDDANKEHNDIDINIKESYDKIQSYILKDKGMKAVSYLHAIFHQSGFAKEMKNESEETKKEALLLFMYKIFMNSKPTNNNNKEEEPENETADKERSKEKLTTDREEIKQLNALKVRKTLVAYLQNTHTFSLQIENSIPIVENLLYSINSSDAIEACSYLGTAYQFQVAGALAAVRKALFQIFSKDQSVRDNLANVYKEIYLGHSDSQMTSRAKALLAVKALIQLLDGMLPGQSAALSKLVVSWRSNKELDVEALQIMWEMFSLKLPNTTEEESRSALMLLRMAAEAEMNIMTDNLNVLVKVGLGPRAQNDLLLARDTCRAILAIKQDCSKDIDKSPIRYPNDHEMFKQITSLLVGSFLEERENGYTSFATDAINVIYQMADQPAQLAEQVLAQVAKLGNFIRSPSSSSQESVVEHSAYSLSRFLFLIGHIGIREMVYLDQSIFKELKRRNTVRELKSEMKARVCNMRHRRKSMNVSLMSIVSNVSASSSINLQVPGSAQRSIRRNKNEEEQEDGMEGATADDTDAEHINMVLEQELLSESGYLRKFVPLILDVCQHPDKYPLEVVQANGVLALSKLMTISSEFCEANLQLFVTILERSAYPQIRANILIGLADLMTRFPNQIEPWTSHIYGRLKDPDLAVRNTCVRMLSNLIMGEMIRVKGQVAHLALCMVDENEAIRLDTKQLFKDLSQKGNALYNVMPDVLSCLSDSELNLTEADFQTIMSYILGLLQKDRQVDSIIEKLCSRFKLATTKRQWRDLSYCLSVLKFSAKGIRILINDLPLLKEQIYNQDVQRALSSIIEGAKRRPEAKMACVELEDKIKELLESMHNQENPGGESQVPKLVSDNDAMPPPKKLAPKSVKKSKPARRRRDEDDEEDEEDEDYGNQSSIGRNSSFNRSTKRGRGGAVTNADDSTVNSGSEEEYTDKTPSRRTTRRTSKTPSRGSATPVGRTPRRRLAVEADTSMSTPTAEKRTRSRRTSLKNSQ
ncbi:condensin complex subunit 1-like isoform X1 [Nasonia vitripennis]|uniref:Condensin complex subunit 1 n=1 Tax=Nasonia vitripennis TaxID=7425 RepID=A0A7M7Q5U0_NASVI|nr:condensin complex subunit 1-like isoform X1 [Nasonia vitripennis]